MELLKFGKNLSIALFENKVTQNELAKHLGTTQQTVSRWVSGVNEPNFITLLEICVYLNETPNSLLGFEDVTEEALNEYRQESQRNKINNK